MKVSEPKILLIHMDPEKARQIAALGEGSSVSFRTVSVSPEEETTPLGILAEAESWMNRDLMKNMPESVPVAEEMLIICGFEDRKMNILLKKLRLNGLSVSLKAVLTDQNSIWSPRQLFGELQAERTYMINRRR